MLISSGRATPENGVFASLIVLVGALCLAGLSGIVAALGSIKLMAVMLALLGGIALIMVPVRYTLWAMLVSTMLLVGPLLYFFRVDAARWIPPIFAMSLALPMAVTLLGRQRQQALCFQSSHLLLGVFIGSVILATALTHPKFGELAGSWRNYLAYLPMLLLVASQAVDQKMLSKVWLFFLVVACVQFPVAVYQKFVISKRVAWSTSQDVIVGTFPGNAEGGGASGAMGLFVVSALVLAMALYRRRQLSGRATLVVGVCVTGTLAFSEVKAMVLLLPVALGLLYIKEVIRRPVRAVGFVIGAVAVSAAILVGYQVQYYAASSAYEIRSAKAPTSPWQSVQNQLDPYRTSRGGYELSRAGMHAFWWKQNVAMGDTVHSLLGWGAGSTQVSQMLGKGEVAQRYPYALRFTGTSMLLWETGLVGHALFLMMLAAATYNAWSLARRLESHPFQSAALDACAVIFLLFALTLPYKAFAFDTPPTQLLLAWCLGQLGWCGMQISSSAKPSRSRTHAHA